jgi:malonate-semialdehyde dehydrogenase (acetylating)/methylmalonate-semialdehyde dehydrogenase
MTATALRTLANHIGGQWREARGGETLVSRNPATSEPLARVPLSTAADVADAAAAARAALPGWRATSPVARARSVMDLRTRLFEHRDELARIVTADMGKTLADAAGEVGRGIESVEAAAAVPHLLKGENLEGVAPGVDVELVRQPVGVVAAITPFNFPAMIPLWFLPYAVACGNTLVLKPSERDPLAGERIVELCESVFPPGVVNLVHGGRPGHRRRATRRPRRPRARRGGDRPRGGRGDPDPARRPPGRGRRRRRAGSDGGGGHDRRWG